MNTRLSQAQFAAWVGIVGNILLAGAKLLIGMIADSRALIADAVHSASDVVGSLAVLIGLRAAERPPDEEHPYGHGKAESIAAIIVAVLLLVIGVQIGYSSFGALFEPITSPGILAVWAAILSMLVKEAMFRYKYRLGKKLNSQALIANAWEHRSDVYSSVAALVGIGGAILGGLWQVPWMVYLDPLAGIIVSLMVLKMAYHILMDSIRNTLDQVLPDEETRSMVEAVEQITGVKRVDTLLARAHGHYLIVDVKLSVEATMTVLESHRIGKQVKQKLMEQFEEVRDVFFHINPYVLEEETNSTDDH